MKETALLDIKLFWIVTYRFHDVYLAQLYYDFIISDVVDALFSNIGNQRAS